MRHLKAAMAATAIGLALAPAGAAAAQQQCSTGDAATAAGVLYGEGTELVRTERVAGLQTALVHEPYIAPGTRHRLVFAGGQWCSAETGLNKAWLASGRPVGDGRALAAAYARLAAAPYFDDTTVTSHRAAAGVHTITTHARTNGVTAAWVVRTDAQGVRSARWTSTGFGVRPLEAQIEGLTALKGATETYRRAEGNALVAARGLPTRADLAIEQPAATLTYNTPDGFAIHVVASDSRQMVDVGADTGVYEADKLTMRAVRRMVAENYQEFYDWGFRGAWSKPATRVFLVNGGNTIPSTEKTGYVYMNDAVTAYCLACVFIADDFQIHMFQEVEEALVALGFSYPAGREYDAYSNIIGHEMMHNWQNNYVKPTSTRRSTPGSYSEGTARFQETLHDYSDVSHQTGSLVYGNNANGCNGAVGTPPDASLATGVFQNYSYAACQFWLPWYTSAGPEVFARLVAEGAPHGATIPEGETRNSSGKVIEAIKFATARPYVESAAAWARSIITGEGMTYGSFLEGGLEPRDWGKYLERWTPAPLAVGQSASRTLQNGGIMGHEITGSFRPQVAGEADIAVIRDTPEGSTITYPAAGELVAGPGAGERVYLIAARPVQGSASVTLTAARP